MAKELARPLDLGPMPLGRPMETVDERLVRASVNTIFEIASRVENWPAHLSHYRYVRFRERRSDGGGLVEMSAFRPFQIIDTSSAPVSFNWPTWWLSEMSVNEADPSIRFRHVEGVTKGMDVEWSFTPAPPGGGRGGWGGRGGRGGTHVRILHVWDGPRIPVLGVLAAKYVIGPVFVHGIASRTLAGLARVAESQWQSQS
ncbi:MAG TPA: SRPBCC family protein [Gemmatimonadaceae bacterium]